MTPHVGPITAALLLAWPALAASGDSRVTVDVRPSGAVDIHASGAPAAQVLERLAEQAGIKLVYVERSAPQDPLTLDISAPSVAQAARELLDKMGVLYALKGPGTRIDTLLIVGASQARPSGPPSAAEEDDPLDNMVKPIAYPTEPPPAARAPRSRVRPPELKGPASSPSRLTSRREQ